MKKHLSISIVIAGLIFGMTSMFTTFAFAESEEENNVETSEVKKTEDDTIHPEGEDDALSGKIQEISPDAPPILIQISPVSNQVKMEAGKAKEYTMTVKNAGSADFSYHVYATPYSVADEDYNISFSNESNRTQISRWIKFYQKEDELVEKAAFKIKSGETQLIKYRVDVPENIPSGGQYATIFAETDIVEDEENQKTSGIRTASRVGMIIYGRTNGETDEVGEIVDYNVPGFMIGGKISATSKVKNTGNTDFEAGYTFVVESITGEQLYSKTTSYNVLPDTERRVNLEWDETPWMGVYKVKYRVQAVDDIREEEKLVIIYPIFMIILTILVLTGIIISVIILIRKRKERNARLAV